MVIVLFVRLLLHYYGFVRLPDSVDAEIILYFLSPTDLNVVDCCQDLPSSAQKTSVHAPGLMTPENQPYRLR